MNLFKRMQNELTFRKYLIDLKHYDENLNNY